MPLGAPIDLSPEELGQHSPPNNPARARLGDPIDLRPDEVTVLPSEPTYDTPLNAGEERQFQAWKQRNAPHDSGDDYDLRGAFKAGLVPASNGHWPDTFKKPNHPTFSTESIYAKARPDRAGRWDGDAYVPASAGPQLGAPLDPLDDFELFDALETEREQPGNYDPAEPSLPAKMWHGVKSFLGDVTAAGSEVMRMAMQDGPDLKTNPEFIALMSEGAGKLLGNYKTLGEGAKTTTKKGVYKLAALASPVLAAEMQKEAHRAMWDFLREQRDVDQLTSNFNQTLENLFPQVLRGLGEVPVDQQAAAGVALVGDPANYVPVGAAANWSIRAPLRGAVNAARAGLRDTALQVAEHTANREALITALKAKGLTSLERSALQRKLLQATQGQGEASLAREASQAAFDDVLGRQAVELEALRNRVPLLDRLTGRVVGGTGATVDATGRAAGALARFPEWVASKVAAAADDTAREAVAGGVRNLAGAFGMLPAAAGITETALRAGGRDLRAIGRILAEAEGQLPFFRRAAKETGGLTSFGASLVDKSGAAPLVTALGRSARQAAPGAAFMGTLGFVGSGGDPEQIIPSAGVGAFLGMAGAGFGQWRRYANPEVVKARQSADTARYRATLLPEQHKWFDKLNREDRTALSTFAHMHPDLQIRYARMGKGADGFWYLGDDAGVAVVNMDSPRPLRSIVAHEVGHHVAAHGLDAPIQRILMGDEAAGTAGLYTTLDANGKLVPTPEFQKLKAEYNAKVQATAQRSGQPLEARSDADVAREIFAEHAADYLLSNNKAGATRAGREMEGFASDRVIQRLAQSELVNNHAFLRDLLAKSGAVFNADGRVVGSSLFGGLGRSPELTELVSQYHRKAAQLRQAESISDGESGGISYDAGQIRAKPEILDRLFDASGDVARTPDGKVIKNPDGTPKFLTEKEQAQINRSLTERIHAWVAENPEAAKGLRLEERPKKGGGTEQVLVGNEIPAALLEQLAADKQFNPAQIRHLQELSAALKQGNGNVFTFFYQPAMKSGNKRYRSLKGDWRTEAPYAIEVTKSGNIVLRTVSKEKLIANAQQLLQKGRGELWSGLPELLHDVDTYLANHVAGRPGGEGLGVDKRDAINDLFGVRLPSNAGVNPVFDQFARKPGDVIFRSRRLDRLNRLTPVDETFKVDYQRVKQNLRPADSAPNEAVERAPGLTALDGYVGVPVLNGAPYTPDFVIHNTSSRAMQGILKNGLDPAKSTEKHVFAWQALESAKDLGHGKTMLLVRNRGRFTPGGADGAVVSSEKIPASDIIVVSPDNVTKIQGEGITLLKPRGEASGPLKPNPTPWDKFLNKDSQLRPSDGPAPTDWDQVEPGMEFDKIKKLIPKAADYVPGFATMGKPETVYQRIKAWLEMNPVAVDADGRKILLAATEGGGTDRLLNRAKHLASQREGGQQSHNERAFDQSKARLVVAVPKTLSDYHAKVERHGNTLYFRRYADGTLHMVVVDPNRRLTTQGVVDGSLITQFSPEAYSQFKDGKLVSVRTAGP